MGILASDTSSEAEQLQIQIFRAMAPERKAALLSAAIRAGLTLGRTEMQDPFEITYFVVRVLEELAIEYFVGGSVASTLHGEPRFTQDTDLIVRLKSQHVEPLIQAVQELFHASSPALLEAIQRKSSSNLVHFASGYKIDLMVSRERPFERSRFERKVKRRAAGHDFWVSSPEDIVLVKLECFRLGNEMLDHQWRDVLTVMLTNTLDQDYLTHWAAELKVLDLLEKARHVLRSAGDG